MEENQKCYEFKTINFDDGLFKNNSIDATYIIHLKHNGRIHDINKQLIEYHPNNIVHIVLNEGFKK
jgi:acetylglutamate kinase